jgi:hypothetical protein
MISAEKSPIMDCIGQPFLEANSPQLVTEKGVRETKKHLFMTRTMTEI